MGPPYWTTRMNIARYMYVAYVQKVTGVTYWIW